MNYNRRSTRPDASYYRDTRKIRRGSGGGGKSSMKPVAIILVLAVVAALVFWVLHNR